VLQCSAFRIVLFSLTETGSGNDVTYNEEETVNIESVSLRDDDTSANDDAILSRDEAGSRDAEALEGVGARPKTTTKTLQRKNTPAVLPKEHVA